MGILKDNRKSVLLKVYIESNMDKDFFILSSKKDPFLITDLNGQVAFVNQKLEELADYSRAELLTMRLCDLFVPIGLDETQTFFREKDIETLNNFDTRLVASKGNKVDVNVTTFPIFFEGEYLGSYIVLKDVTHLKLNRKLRIERERQHRQLIENSPEPIFILQSSKIINVNKKGIILLRASDREELVGRNLLEVIHPDSIEIFKRKIGQADMVDITDLFELKMLSLDGVVLNVEMMAFPTIVNGEQACHVLIKDKSESLKLSLISQKQAVAGQLAAGVAHEIRNPITAIKGFLQLIMRESEGNRVYLEIIDSEITRIETILNELLVLAKPGKQKDECINIRLLLEQVITLMEPQALLNDIIIDNQLRHLNAVVRGDENQLKQVFINYIKNSIDAMSNGGKLGICAKCTEQNTVQIKVTDQGGGIPEEIIGKVGNPFFTTKENGTGLGMLVSSQIIHDHKGSITINSDRIGTCIEVNLPTISS